MPNSSQERRLPDRIRSMVIGTSSLSMGLVRGAGAQLQVPSAMGMILSGMLLRNVNDGLAIIAGTGGHPGPSRSGQPRWPSSSCARASRLIWM